MTIAIDTHVLVLLLDREDEAQYASARRLVNAAAAAEQPVLIVLDALLTSRTRRISAAAASWLSTPTRRGCPAWSCLRDSQGEVGGKGFGFGCPSATRKQSNLGGLLAATPVACPSKGSCRGRL